MQLRLYCRSIFEIGFAIKNAANFFLSSEDEIFKQWKLLLFPKS